MIDITDLIFIKQYYHNFPANANQFEAESFNLQQYKRLIKL